MDDFTRAFEGARQEAYKKQGVFNPSRDDQAPSPAYSEEDTTKASGQNTVSQPALVSALVDVILMGHVSSALRLLSPSKKPQSLRCSLGLQSKIPPRVLHTMTTQRGCTCMREGGPRMCFLVSKKKVSRIGLARSFELS